MDPKTHQVRLDRNEKGRLKIARMQPGSGFGGWRDMLPEGQTAGGPAVLDWSPAGGVRKVGHQLKRWPDDIERVIQRQGLSARGGWGIAAFC